MRCAHELFRIMMIILFIVFFFLLISARILKTRKQKSPDIKCKSVDVLLTGQMG